MEKSPTNEARGRILLVEDNPISRRVLRLILSRGGFDVRQAEDGAQALALALEERPDLILLDLILPDIHGLELSRRLLALPGCGDLPILACSGEMAVTPSQLAEAGCCDFVEKPPQPGPLLALIAAHLRAHRPRHGEGKSVLLVDDDVRRLFGLRRRLERQGFAVQTARSAEEALGLASAPGLLAVLCETHLPGQDGFDLAAALRGRHGDGGPAVLLLSAAPLDPGARQLALLEGADDLLPRTIGLQEVEEALRSLAASGRLPERTPEPPEGSCHAHYRRLLRQENGRQRENAALARRVEGMETSLQILASFSEALVNQGDLKNTLHEVMLRTVDASGLSAGALVVRLGPEEPLFSVGCEPAMVRDALRALEGPLAERQLILRRPDGAAPEVRALMARAEAEGLIVAPLLAGEQVCGALLMLSEVPLDEREDTVLFVRAVSNQLGLALMMAQAIERERRLAAEESATRAQWQALAEQAPEMVLLLDHGGVIQFASKGGWGMTREALVGRSVGDLLPPGSLAAWRQALGKVISEGTPTNCEVLRPSGSEGQWVSFQLGPFAGAGSPGVIVAVRDITQRRQDEARLMVADRMISVGVLASGVAHEVNNPLTAISTNLELARAELIELGLGTQGQELLDMLDDAHQAAGRVREIVRDLKIFSRSEEERRGPVDLRETLETTIRLGWNEIRHRARLVRDYQTVPPIEGNESRLGQVFLNLLLNATQALAEGQTERNEIRVSVSLLPPGRVMVRVYDNGSGMTPEVRARLFTPFFTTKPIGEGTGLGLTICRRIVEAHGGELSVESELGRGTMVQVILPIKTAPAEPRIAAPEGPGQRGRVLVIDDEPVIATAVRRLLSGEHQVTTTQHAQEALAWLREGQTFDAILCDLMMPQMTGMAFHRELCGSFPQLAERVIFLSGGAFTVEARQFLDQVPNVRLEKPFQSKQLRELVGKMVRFNMSHLDGGKND